MEKWTDNWGSVWEIHSGESCEGKCPFHNPSEHHLNTAPILIRVDKDSLVERLCEHGVGHDDPDSVDYFHSQGQKWAGIHGCDGCCTGRYPILAPTEDSTVEVELEKPTPPKKKTTQNHEWLYNLLQELSWESQGESLTTEERVQHTHDLIVRQIELRYNPKSDNLDFRDNINKGVIDKVNNGND